MLQLKNAVDANRFYNRTSIRNNRTYRTAAVGFFDYTDCNQHSYYACRRSAASEESGKERSGNCAQERVMFMKSKISIDFLTGLLLYVTLIILILADSLV